MAQTGEQQPPAAYQVRKWLLEGHDGHQIGEALAQLYGRDDAAELIGQALEEFCRIGQAKQSQLRGWCLEAYREIYSRALRMDDYGAALRAVNELRKLAESEEPPDVSPSRTV
ncbi:MAG: hypothetical protein GTO04_01490 [Planctomycetales bacterium]|nr:hypothetical protein [Planctomycetales bacterium]